MNCPNCGKPEAHFVPPSCGEPGFFICDMKTIHEPAASASTVETLTEREAMLLLLQWVGEGKLADKPSRLSWLYTQVCGGERTLAELWRSTTPKATESPRTDEFQARIASSGSTHGAYELCLDHARQLEHSLAAKTAELEEAKEDVDRLTNSQAETSKIIQKYIDDLAASQQRCERLGASIEKMAAAFDRWKYAQCSDVDFHDIVKRALTKEPR